MTDTAAIHEFVLRGLRRSLAQLLFNSCLYPIRHRPRWLPGSRGCRAGFPPPLGTSRSLGTRRRGTGRPDRVTRPGAARQAASPSGTTLQRRHARHGKVRGSEPKSRDSAPPGCSLLCLLASPAPLSSENPAAHSQPQPPETTSPVP